MAGHSVGYKSPKWYRIYWKDSAAEITDEQIEAWRKETTECEDYNRPIFDALFQKRKQCFALFRELWGEDSNQFRYLLRQDVPSAPRFDFRYSVEKPIQEARKKVAAEARKKAAAVAARSLVAEAIAWLLERGKKLGEDFTAEDAVDTADDIAYEEEVARLQAMDGLHEFCGSDFCEDCGGWDGKSHRCECGNRRVYWTQGCGHSFKEPYVYAEAS